MEFSYPWIVLFSGLIFLTFTSTNAEYFSVNWISCRPGCFPDLEVRVGDQIEFHWVATHDIAWLANQKSYDECDFGDAPTILSTTDFIFEVTSDHAGSVIFFGCSINAGTSISHCDAKGMKFRAIVQDVDISSSDDSSSGVSDSSGPEYGEPEDDMPCTAESYVMSSLSENLNLDLHWTLNQGSIAIKITTRQTDNWIAFGFSTDGTMKSATPAQLGGESSGSDAVISLVRDSDTDTGLPSTLQYNIKDYFLPEIIGDDSQDLKDVSRTNIDGKTIVRFERRLVTQDPTDFVISTISAMNVIWAVGQSPNLNYHGQENRGASRISFGDAICIIQDPTGDGDSDDGNCEPTECRAAGVIVDVSTGECSAGDPVDDGTPCSASSDAIERMNPDSWCIDGECQKPCGASVNGCYCYYACPNPPGCGGCSEINLRECTIDLDDNCNCYGACFRRFLPGDCFGSCGALSSEGSCYCDELCGFHGDCCLTACQQCRFCTFSDPDYLDGEIPARATKTPTQRPNRMNREPSLP